MCRSLFIAVAFSFGFSLASYAQVANSWQPVPRATQMSVPTQEYGMRPYVPYPGQPGFRATTLQPAMQSQNVIPSSGQEIIVSQQPIEGTIIGVVQADGSIVPMTGQTSQPAQSKNAFLFVPEQKSSEQTELSDDQDTELLRAKVGELKSLAISLQDALDRQRKDFAATKATMRTQIEELQASKRAQLAEASKQIELLRIAQQDTLTSKKVMPRKKRTGSDDIAVLKNENAVLKAALAKASEQLKLSDSIRGDASALRKKLVMVHRNMVKVRRDLDEKDDTIGRLRRLNTRNRESDQKVRAQLTELKATLDQQKKEHDQQIAKMDKEYQSNAEAHRKALKELEETRADLATQRNNYATLRSEIIRAYEKKQKAEKAKEKKSLSEAEVREQWKKRREQEEAKKKSAEGDGQKKKSAKVTERSEREKDLREEMKRKMADAERRIRAVGKRKVTALIKEGKKDDSKEVKSEKENIEKSVRISNRKIRARYERKIQRLR